MLWGVDCYRRTVYKADWFGDFIGSHGGNTVRISTNAYPISQSVDADLIKCRQTTRAANVQLAFSSHADNTTNELEDRTGRANAILNINSAGDQWIAHNVSAIQTYDPDIIEVMNEPPSPADYPFTFNDYRNFCIRAITAYRQAKPTIKIWADSSPWWDLSPWASNPLPFTDAAAYVCHIHYLLPSPQPTDLGYAYWHAYNIATDATGLAAARTELFNTLLNKEHLQDLVTNGLPIMFAESGTSRTLPNNLAYLKDLTDFIKQYGVGFLQFALSAVTNMPDGNNGDPEAIINDYNIQDLSILGQSWVDNMPSVSPTKNYVFTRWQDGNTNSTKTVTV